MNLATQATRDHPASRAAWMLLGTLAHEAGDEQQLRQALDQMERWDERWAPLLMALGYRAMQQGDFTGAQQHFDEAHRLWPLNIAIQEALIQLDLHFDQTGTEALDRIRNLLGIDPWNPWGNFALGVYYYQQDEHVLAESALLRTVGTRPFPIAYNNLAWILYQQGRHDDALFYARNAIEREPNAAAFWDTLAHILEALGDTEAAAEAWRTAADQQTGSL